MNKQILLIAGAVVIVVALFGGSAYWYWRSAHTPPAQSYKVNPNAGKTDVKPKAVAAISGKATIGPVCPVEREGVPCVTPPETYTSREVAVYRPDGETLVAKQNLSPDGTYRFELEEGSYVLKQIPAGMDRSEGLPYAFYIRPGSDINLDFSIDTGIR
jgi:hypothetical protein